MNRQPAVSIFVLLMALFLSACSTSGRKVTLPAPFSSSDAPAAPFAAIPASERSESGRRVRQLLTLLEEAEQAMADKRLTTPAGYNARSFYSRVLKLQPGNEEARQGLVRIMDRYIQWSDAALGQGRVTRAAAYLDRAVLIDKTYPALLEARKRLRLRPQAEQNFLPLDSAGLRARSAAVRTQLGAIADRVRQRDSRIVIQAPEDRLGRWIYQQLNRRHESYRVRASMKIAASAGIRLLD